jgi:hypothetical protein
MKLILAAGKDLRQKPLVPLNQPIHANLRSGDFAPFQMPA